MAKTYAAIQTIICNGGESSVTFSNIPQNYTDLLIKISARTARADYIDDIDITFNGDTTSSYKSLTMQNNQGSTQSLVNSGLTSIIRNTVDGSSATANTFGNLEIYIPNYTSSNYKSISVDTVTETNGTNAWNGLVASLWNKTSAINSITFRGDQANFVQYSTFTLYGIGSGAKATGGTVVGAGNYIYHTFTASGTFTPTELIKNAEVLVVGGGGGGGSYYTNNAGGGGGAGGLLWTPSQSFIAGSNYSCIIGAGSGGDGSGSNSSFASLIAFGGGVGGRNSAGGSGGSGGGGAGNGGTTNSGGSGTVGQGNNGGASSTGQRGTGGGGGAGGVGQDGQFGTNSGNGGIGSYNFNTWHYATQTGQNINGTYYIAGGGGGGISNFTTAGTGGYGGGGQGATSGGSYGTNALSNTGGGGGGGGYASSNGGFGANGGSGLIIIRYPIN